MTRSFTTTTLADPKTFKEQLITWGAAYDTMIWLDGNDHKEAHGNFDALLAVGEFSELRCNSAKGAFDKLAAYQAEIKDWIFGYLTYDLKNDLENLDSENKDNLQFPALYFFQPKKICTLRGNVLTQMYLPEVQEQAETDYKDIQNQPKSAKNGSNSLKIEPLLSKSEYLEQVFKMLAHIRRGDIYEANFCQEFYANGKIDPLETFRRFNRISQAPFAAYFKTAGKHLLCTSPERYLRKKGDKLISQPIKGTARRSENPEEDAQIAQNLQNDEKERSENIMITDLVRNDLSRVAQKGSVTVDELCKVYSFKQVHQMISTISATINPKIPVIDLLKKTFPMGSMTGAPKVSAMKIIEDLETHKRGLYSGALGYFTPEADFDFNVVIRSILYDEMKACVSFSVGSAITAMADPEREYEECLLKAKAMREVLGG